MLSSNMLSDIDGPKEFKNSQKSNISGNGYTEEGHICKTMKIIVIQSFHPEMLEKIHDRYLSVGKCIMRAGSVLH